MTNIIMPWNRENGRRLYALISMLVDLSEKVRKEGLLAIESALEELKNRVESVMKEKKDFDYHLFFKMAQFVVDGTDRSVLVRMVRPWIANWTRKGTFMRLTCEIIYTALLSIQEGNNPRIMTFILLGMVPKKYWVPQLKGLLPEEVPAVDEYPVKEADSKILDKLDNSTFQFEDIAVLNNRAVQVLMREIPSEELAKAISSEKPEVQNRFFRNMSRVAAKMLKDDIDYMGPINEKDSGEARQKILSILRGLKDQKFYGYL